MDPVDGWYVITLEKYFIFNGQWLGWNILEPQLNISIQHFL